MYIPIFVYYTNSFFKEFEIYTIQAKGIDTVHSLTLSIIVSHILNVIVHVTSHIIALPGTTYVLMKKI